MDEATLTADEEGEIAALLAHAPAPRAVCGDALRAVQKRRGWISDASLAAVAGRLGMTVAELDALATFYNFIFRRPVGRHVVLVCDSISCWVGGAGRLARSLGDLLGIAPGETTADGEFTLLPAACLGACDHAPVMMVDEELFLDVSPEQLPEIINRFRGGPR